MRGWLFAFVALQIAAVGLLARAAPVLGMHLAGQAWENGRFSKEVMRVLTGPGYETAVSEDNIVR